MTIAQVQRAYAFAPDYWAPREVSGLGDSRMLTGAIGQSLMAAGTKLMVAHPLVGAITMAVGAATQLIGSLFKPDLKKIEATRIVDDIESQSLKPLLQAWRSLPREEKTYEAQQQFLNFFDEAWNAVVQGCSNPQLEQAGVNCIADRQQGACKWHDAAGQCWNWFSYRDEIANDPDVHSESLFTSGNGSASSVSDGSTGIPWLPLALIAGALLL